MPKRTARFTRFLDNNNKQQTTNMDTFYPGYRFITIWGDYGTVIRLANWNENGADFYFDEENYVVEMDVSTATVTYNINGCRIMTRGDMM